MLYAQHEHSKQIMAPVVRWAEVTAELLRDPKGYLKMNPASKYIAAWCEFVFRLGKHYDKPEFGIRTANGVAIDQEVVLDKPFCRLLHFKKVTPVVQPKILLVAPLSGHHATLLRDTVSQLLQDHDVYITDWKDARDIPAEEGAFFLDNYVYYVQDFLHFLGGRINVVAVCQPTVPVLGAVALMAEKNDPNRPLTMTLMGGPIDTRLSPTEVNELATKHPIEWFENTLIQKVPTNYTGAGRLVYPGFIQHASFIMMNPKHHSKSYWEFFMHLCQGNEASAEEHRKFYDEYNAVLDMPAEYYLETVETVFQKHLLPKGEWIVGSRTVVPSAIKDVALFTVEGEKDDICGLGQTQAAHNLCSSIPEANKEHYIAPGCGHYGIFAGKRWRTLIYPRITDFINKHKAA